MILRRLSGFQDKGSLAGALVKGGLVVVKVGKLVLALACSSPASRNGAGTKRHPGCPCSPATCPAKITPAQGSR